jgi:hypothetical protein
MSSVPTLSGDPQTVPLDDLRAAAGLNDPQPVPVVAEPTPVAPAPVVPEAYTVAQDENGVTITLAPEFGGEVYKGKDAHEALAKIAKAKADANVYIKQLKAQPPAAPVQPAPSEPQPTVEELAAEEWVATAYEKTLARRMGLTVDQLRAQQRISMEGAPAVFQERQEVDFKKSNQDWVETPENLEAMKKAFEGVQLEYGFPTAAQLDFAWNYLKGKGMVRPMQFSQPQASTKPPVPMPGSVASPAQASAENPWTMDLNALKSQAGLK